MKGLDTATNTMNALGCHQNTFLYIFESPQEHTSVRTFPFPHNILPKNPHQPRQIIFVSSVVLLHSSIFFYVVVSANLSHNFSWSRLLGRGSWGSSRFFWRFNEKNNFFYYINYVITWCLALRSRFSRGSWALFSSWSSGCLQKFKIYFEMYYVNCRTKKGNLPKIFLNENFSKAYNLVKTESNSYLKPNPI
jgi:hypothetical protein